MVKKVFIYMYIVCMVYLHYMAQSLVVPVLHVF